MSSLTPSLSSLPPVSTSLSSSLYTMNLNSFSLHAESKKCIYLFYNNNVQYFSLSSFIPSRFALIFFNPLLHKKWYNAFKRAIFLSNTAVSYV